MFEDVEQKPSYWLVCHQRQKQLEAGCSISGPEQGVKAQELHVTRPICADSEDHTICQAYSDLFVAGREKHLRPTFGPNQAAD